MKTDQLIAAMVADAQSSRLGAKRSIWLALGLGMALSIALFLPTMGVRGDLADVLMTWRFDLKLVLVYGAVVGALVDCIRFMRPEVQPSLHWSTATVLILLVVAVMVELSATSSSAWKEDLIGTNSMKCLVSIPALALLPFTALTWAMRRGAPASPLWAGAAVGRLAAASGAALYALHCFDDLPLFVAVWYSTAILIVSAVGAVVGARVLRW